MVTTRVQKNTDQDCSKKDWKKIRAKALNYARRRGANEVAEDFAQYYCIAIFRGRKTSLKNLFTDFMRSNFGDLRNEIGIQKAREKIEYKDLNGPYNCYADLAIEPFIDWTSEEFFDETFDFLSEFDRALLRSYRDGKNCAEIGAQLDCSPTRVSQKFKIVKDKIKKNFGQKSIGFYA